MKLLNRKFIDNLTITALSIVAITAYMFFIIALIGILMLPLVLATNSDNNYYLLLFFIITPIVCKILKHEPKERQ